MKKICLLFFLLPLLQICAADEPVKMKVLYKAAKTAMKNRNGQDKAKADLVQAAASRPELSNKDKAKIYYHAALLDQNSNSVQNQLFYLKQQKDSTAIFATILKMYQSLALCDSVDAIPNSSGKIKPKFKNKSKALKKKHSANLLTGGKFFLKKGDFANAYTYLDTYMESNPTDPDSVLNKLSYWATICAYNVKNPLNTLKYSTRAIVYADSIYKPVLQEYRVRCYQSLKSDESYFRELQIGVNKYPKYDFFMVNIIDWFMHHRKFDEGLALVDSMLQENHEKPLFWYGKSLMCLGKQDFNKCIAYSDSCIIRDDKYVDAYYNKGLSYCNLAIITAETLTHDLKDSANIEKKKIIQDLYQKARPCMEKVREFQPDNKDRWAKPLYRIYLNLNMGSEFDEIDKILNAPTDQKANKG